MALKTYKMNARNRKLYEIRSRNSYRKQNPSVKILMWKFYPKFNTIVAKCVPIKVPDAIIVGFKINNLWKENQVTIG